MEYITIKKDSNLEAILDFIKKEPKEFIFHTLNYLEVNDWIADASDEWGKTIGEILRESNVESYGVAVLALNTNIPNVVEAFMNLVIIGRGDCPECGGNMQERFSEPDPTKGTDDYVCDKCGHETKPEHHNESCEDN